MFLSLRVLAPRDRRWSLKASMGMELGFNLLKSRFCSFLSSVSVADVSNFYLLVVLFQKL